MEDIKARYSNYDEKIQMYLSAVIDYFVNSYGFVSSEQIMNLDMLAENFVIYFKALNSIKTLGFESNDSQGRLQRNPSVSIFLNCQNYIQKQLSACGLTIASQARLKKNGVDEQPDNFIENLVN